MKRGLKCPRCQGHNAYLEFGYNERLDKRYRQKHCGCGFAGAKRYSHITRTEAREMGIGN